MQFSVVGYSKNRSIKQPQKGDPPKPTMRSGRLQLAGSESRRRIYFEAIPLAIIGRPKIYSREKHS
jgi:hypothetical protein